MEFTATLHGATRKRNSANGNPSWVLHTSEGDFRTQTDASLGYDVSNHTQTRDESENWIGKRVVLTRTSAGRITYWRRAQDTETD